MNSLEFDRYAGGALGLLAYTLSIFRTKGEGGQNLYAQFTETVTQPKTKKFAKVF